MSKSTIHYKLMADTIYMESDIQGGITVLWLIDGVVVDKQRINGFPETALTISTIIKIEAEFEVQDE